VAGEDEDAMATGAGGEVVLEAFVAEELLGIGAIGAGHAAELGYLPTEIPVKSAEDAGAPGGGHAGEAERKVAQADAAQARNEAPGCGSYSRAEEARDGAGKPLEDGHDEAKSEVFGPFAD
jgi:hypothetical protein